MHTQGSRAGVVALTVVALLVAMTGGATARALITGRDIKDGSVTGADLRNGSVAGADIKDGSLSRRDFVGALVGPPGAAGPPGPQGPSGPQGASGVGGYEHQVADVVVPAGKTARQDAVCTAGKVAAGGGISSSSVTGVRVVESAPLDGGTGWTAGLLNTSANTVTAYVWAVCVNPS